MTQRTMAFTLGMVAAAAIAALADGTRNPEIAAAIKQRVDDKKAVGMVVATIEPDGSTSMAAYGNPGPDAMPLDADSVFEIGSITKVFTAVLLADMAERGEVKLDDPVARFLPDTVRVPERNGRKITLLDLTTQSSGLPRMPDNLHPKDMTNPYADYTPEQMFEFLGRYELTRDIGAQYRVLEPRRRPARAGAHEARREELRGAGQGTHSRSAGDDAHRRHADTVDARPPREGA